MHGFQRSHPTVTISTRARPLELTLKPPGATLRRTTIRVVPLVGRASNPTGDFSHRSVDVEQGRNHLVEAQGHRVDAIARRGASGAVTEARGFEIGPESIYIEVPPGSATLCSVDGRLGWGGVEGPGHHPMVRRTSWNTDDINRWWSLVLSGASFLVRIMSARSLYRITRGVKFTVDAVIYAVMQSYS